MASEEQLLEQLKWVTTQLRTARAIVTAHEAAAREPIAVVGIGCRFPGGVAGPEDLWDLVADGRDATGEVPPARGWDAWPWFHPDPEHEGTSYVRRGGFLDDVDAFDNGFFGIAPREALAMDPQQRLLLETSWEAFERAGIDPDDLAGSDVGVFAGVAYNGYGASGGPGGEHAGHGLTGASPAVAAGRLSYTFGFHGPAVTVDTMCSSSLVALDLACRSLRAGECSAALAAGAMVIADPTEFVEFSRQGALSPDGRCRPFSAQADGTAWAEGVGVLLVEPLSRARELGHPVWAVVRGSAVNQDGRSNGLTAPNASAQRAVISAALGRAALHPHEIDMVEAHGTGTRLGDPIEARALAEVYGHDRPRGPLMLGSVKSNIGHAQAAGGMAGVIKTIMALRHGRMPASLHAEDPTAEAAWGEDIALLDSEREWPAGPAPRRAAVSSFGASGTNAHVVLEEAPAAARPPAAAEAAPVQVWPLSGLDACAVRAQAARLAHALPHLLADTSPNLVGAALAGRHAFAERAVVVGAPAELAEGLDALAAGEPTPAVVAGRALPAPRVVFVFPGQGAQWPGMAAELLDHAPAFTAALAECEAALAPHVPWTVRDVLRGAPGAPDLGRVDVLQPVTWAVNVALAAEWRAHGVEPAAVVGHSQGEVAAAVVAGALTVADGARVIAQRSRLVGARLAGAGAMASLRMAAPERDALLAGEPEVELAGHTGPTSVVVSGTPDGVARLAAAAPDHVRTIDVDYASHTRHVDVLRAELAA
ncbi:MAG: type I polyketide synthase, partial [Pseudonocardia sp.]|nr:type I polyketide synthase [Pseudonocardia sp.]